MIDLNKLQNVAERAVKIQAGKEQLFSADEVIAVFEKLRQAEKDAARYRWLRDTAHTVTGLTPCAFVMMDGELMEDWNGQYGLLYLGALDAAIGAGHHAALLRLYGALN